MPLKFRKVEEGIVPIYESDTKERVINARELHIALECNTKFADWIKRRIKYYKNKENDDFIFNNGYCKRIMYGRE